MYVCIYVCMYICMYVYMYVCVHVCMCVYMYIYVCMYICMYIYVYMTDIPFKSRIHTYIHIHIHIYIYIPSPLQPFLVFHNLKNPRDNTNAKFVTRAPSSRARIRWLWIAPLPSCMYVCMYVSKYVCMYVWMCRYMDTGKHVCLNFTTNSVRIYMYVYTCTYSVRIYMYVCTPATHSVHK
jgi:hypothetical protein